MAAQLLVGVKMSFNEIVDSPADGVAVGGETFAPPTGPQVHHLCLLRQRGVFKKQL